MNGHFVPIVPGGGHNRLTFHNRQEYVEKAIHFRLHELDQQASGTLVTYWWFRIHVCLPYTIAGGCCQGRHVIHCTCSTALSLHCSDVGSHCVWERAGWFTGPQEGGEVLFLHACVYACTYIVQRYSHFIYSILTKVSWGMSCNDYFFVCEVYFCCNVSTCSHVSLGWGSWFEIGHNGYCFNLSTIPFLDTEMASVKAMKL